VNVLVDTSVWSLALRRKAQNLNAAEAAVVAELSQLVREGRARLIGLVRQELLSGIRDAGQYEKLRNILRAFPDEEASLVDYEAAARAGNTCRARGIAVSVSDMLICALAVSREWAIFSTDPDFKKYAKVLPIQLHTSRR
jgi:predicted nucleic acid-binding protein